MIFIFNNSLSATLITSSALAKSQEAINIQGQYLNCLAPYHELFLPMEVRLAAPLTVDTNKIFVWFAPHSQIVWLVIEFFHVS